MNLKKHQYILDRIINRSFKAYKIIIGGPGSRAILAENQNGDLNPAQLAEEIDTVLSNNSGNFTVILSEKTASDKGAGGKLGAIESIPLDSREPVNYGMNGPTAANNQINEQLIAEMERRHASELQAQADRLESKHRFEKLELNNSNPAIDSLLTMAGPILQKVLGVNAPAIAGDAQNIEVVEQEADVRAQNALERLAAVYPNILDILEDLALFAETNKSMCDMALTMIKK